MGRWRTRDRKVDGEAGQISGTGGTWTDALQGGGCSGATDGKRLPVARRETSPRFEQNGDVVVTRSLGPPFAQTWDPALDPTPTGSGSPTPEVAAIIARLRQPPQAARRGSNPAPTSAALGADRLQLASPATAHLTQPTPPPPSPHRTALAGPRPRSAPATRPDPARGGDRTSSDSRENHARPDQGPGARNAHTLRLRRQACREAASTPDPAPAATPARPALAMHGTQTTTAQGKPHVGSAQRADARVVRIPAQSGGGPHRATLTSAPPPLTAASPTRQPRPRSTRR